jgi:hypothetical protein
MKKTITLKKNQTYLIYDKNSSIIVFEPDTNTKVNTQVILPKKMTDKNLLASNITLAILQKIKFDKFFINDLIEWFNNIFSEDDKTIH